MRIAIYGRKLNDLYAKHVVNLIDQLSSSGCSLSVWKEYASEIQSYPSLAQLPTFDSSDDIQSFDLIISIGGDGTLLATLTVVKDSGVPILGINTGRLGFLSNVSTAEIDRAVGSILDRAWELDKRSVVKVEDGSGSSDLRIPDFALNEVTLHKKDTASMVTIHVYLDDTFVNSYWADGLIVSTPTGSTAYSLSAGGPIVMPGTSSLVLTPIAPHNLNVRPLVIPNHHTLSVRIEGRDEQFLCSLDSRSYVISSASEIKISPAGFTANLVNLPGQNFFSTIRNKMNWGLDKRN